MIQQVLTMKSILIIDDEPHILIALEFLMKRSGYEIQVARDGETALEAIRTHRPDLVILDVMMPKLDGFAVLESVRADPGLKHLRVLMLTAKGRATDRDRGLKLGADAYLTKPFSTHELIERVRTLLETPT